MSSNVSPRPGWPSRARIAASVAALLTAALVAVSRRARAEPRQAGAAARVQVADSGKRQRPHGINVTERPPVAQPGPPRMPYLIGRDTLFARDTLRHLDVVRPTIVRPGGDSIPLDRIAAQYPDSGTPLYVVKYAVRLTLAGRDTRVVMPGVAGRTVKEASQMLRDSGLIEPPSVVTEPGEGEPRDEVVGQAPLPGARVPPETRAVLTLGRVLPPPPTPSPLARVPSVVGLDSARAIRALADSGFPRHLVRPPPGGSAENVVASQRPTAGSPVPPTTRVVLTLRALGVDTALVPLVVGLTVDSAIQVLRAARLRARVDAWGSQARHGRDVVRSQSPRAGTVAVRGETVTIVPAYRFAWTPLILLLLGGGGLAAGIAARAAWPPPTITPRVRLHPYSPRLTGAGAPFVGASVSLRSRIVHHEPRLRCAGSLLA
jgi:beta-lactam-binding protein with PASTA domain